MHCSSCASEQPDSARYCSACGAALPGERTCPLCGHSLDASAAFCNDCGFGASQFREGLPPRLAVEWREFFNDIGWAEVIDGKKLTALRKAADKRPSNMAWNMAALFRAWGLPIMDESTDEPWMIVIGRLEALRARKAPLVISAMSLRDSAGRVLWKPSCLYVTSKRLVTVKPRGHLMPNEYVALPLTQILEVAVQDDGMTFVFHDGRSLALRWKPRGFVLPPALAALMVLSADTPTDAYHLARMDQISRDRRATASNSAREIFSLFATHLRLVGGA